MKCDNCGAQMTSKRESYLYSESGLESVTLVGVEVRRCPNCGEFEVAIPRIEELHRVIAQVLATKEAKMMAAEIRYLRKYLGFSGVDFAKSLGVSSETVSRWETGKKPMGAIAERALRMMVFLKEPISEYPLERLAGLAQGKPAALPMRVSEKRGGGWKSDAPKAAA